MPSPHPPNPSNQRQPSAAAYRRTRDGKEYPASIIQQYIGENGLPDAAGLASLAARVQLPESTLRSTLSYYADYTNKSPSSAAHSKACNGTSCFLSSKDKPRATSEATTEVATKTTQGDCASCLGHCYQENNYLHDNEVHTTAETGEMATQCLAPTPVTTRRIIANNATKPATSSYAGLQLALQSSPQKIIETITNSGLRGRGGAAFPSGKKWKACASTASNQRYIIANGNEGDAGSYVDRVLLERDPHSVIEGLLIGAYAIGASKGVIYIRSEYPTAARIIEAALKEARDAGHLKNDHFSCEVTVIQGAGSFVCGEETALINAIEGLRGEVRLRPPYPTESGLFGKPTTVDNIETLCNIPFIIEHSAETYKLMGTATSSGTKTLCFNHGFVRPGIIEVEFGTPLQAAIDAAGGSKSPLAAILLGGPMGCVITPDQWDTPVCYEAMQARGFDLGHGSIIALPKSADKAALLRHWLSFMADESCGKCEPCSLGSKRSCQIVNEPWHANSQQQLDDLLHLIGQTSLCAFGREIPRAVSQYLDVFQDEIFTPKSS